MLTRRHFVATATMAATQLRAQTARIDVAAVERDRVLTEAKAAANPTTLVGLSNAIATLTAAFVLTKDQAYADRAATHIATITQRPAQPADATSIDLLPIAEVAVAIRFLGDAFDLAHMNLWLTTLQLFLSDSRDLRIQRDLPDHRASAWLLLSSCIARSQRDEKMLDACRHRYKNPTIRNQITASGTFPQELVTPNPYRNTLFNFDLLAGVCQILGGPFDDLFSYELPDGPGLHTVAAALYPMIQDRNRWSAVSDAEHFHDLPGRRPGLLFTGRAFNQPQYVELWHSTPAAIPAALSTTFPIHEPLLWISRAAHGF